MRILILLMHHFTTTASIFLNQSTHKSYDNHRYLGVRLCSLILWVTNLWYWGGRYFDELVPPYIFWNFILISKPDLNPSNKDQMAPTSLEVVFILTDSWRLTFRTHYSNLCNPQTWRIMVRAMIEQICRNAFLNLSSLQRRLCAFVDLANDPTFADRMPPRCASSYRSKPLMPPMIETMR